MPRHVETGKTAGRRRESDTKQVERQFEYDTETHSDTDPVGSINPAYHNDAGDPITEQQALNLKIARMQDEGRKVRRVVHPGDSTVGPTVDEPRVNMA